MQKFTFLIRLTTFKMSCSTKIGDAADHFFIWINATNTRQFAVTSLSFLHSFILIIAVFSHSFFPHSITCIFHRGNYAATRRRLCYSITSVCLQGKIRKNWFPPQFILIHWRSTHQYFSFFAQKEQE